MFRLILLFLRPALDFGSAVGGFASGVADIFGAAGLPKPNYYTPQGTQQADQAFLQALQAISAATDRNTGQIDPVLLHSYSQLLGIDLSGLVTGGQQAGDAYRNLATQAGRFGTTAGEMGDQIHQTAFDPQGQLHDYLKQQTVDASRGADTTRGLAMSPYSSGNESTALRNFELDWQNRQLGREVTGAQGATGAYNASLGYGTAAPEFTMAGARAPIAGRAAAASAPMDFSTQFLGAENAMFAPQAGVANMALPYIGLGTSAGSNLYNQNFGRSVTQTGMLGQGLENIFMGSGVGSGMGDPSQWFGFQGGNPFSMMNWGGGGAGAGGAAGGGAGGAAGAMMF